MSKVPINLIEELASRVDPPARSPKKSRGRVSRNRQSFDAQAFIDRHGLDARAPKPWKSQDGKTGQLWVLNKDPMDSGHDDASCFVVQFEGGAIAAGCHHDSAAWTWDDLRAKYEPNREIHQRGKKAGSESVAEPLSVAVGNVEVTAVPHRRDDKGVRKSVLKATIGDKVLHMDQLDLSSSRRRNEFTRALVDVVGDIDEDQVKKELLGLAAQVELTPDDVGGDAGDGEIKKSQATMLVELASDAGAKLWHDPHLEKEAFATISVDDHKENHPIRGRRVREWLQGSFYKETGRAAASQAMQEARNTLSAQAMFDGDAHATAVRIAAGTDGVIWLDLCNDDWEFIRIDSTGWHVCPSGGPKFVRRNGMGALPVPVRGGSIDLIWKYLNVELVDRILVLGWLVGALNPSGPYTLLGIHSEQGSCKSTSSRFLRSTIDPNDLPLRDAPRDGRNLAIAAYNSWICSFDNLSFIPPELSDALCRLATGGGYGCRTHYENREETIFKEMRPIQLNGITELATRPDLLDRAIVISLPSVAKSKRRTEREMNAEFKRDHPLILGALLDAVVVGLKRLPSISLPYLPRMADFARWVTACETGLGFQPNDFLAAYESNRSDALAAALEANVVAPPLIDFVWRLQRWEGTATQLLRELEKQDRTGDRKQKGWPRTGSVLSGTLRRLAPPLEHMGISVEFSRSHHPRTVTLEYTPRTPSPASPPSPIVPTTPICGDGSDVRTGPDAVGETKRDAEVGGDGVSPTHSVPEHQATTTVTATTHQADSPPSPQSMEDMMAALQAVQSEVSDPPDAGTDQPSGNGSVRHDLTEKETTP